MNLRRKIYAFFMLSRPYQWHKNVFVFAPLFFSGDFSPHSIFLASITFLSFVFASASVYAFNDVIDLEEDKNHPLKRSRPIASGALSKKEGLIFSFLLFIPPLILASYAKVAYLLILYFVLNIIYSLLIKNKKPADIIFISFGFVIRVFAGGKSIDVKPSDWLITSTFFIAMFISSMKKEAESPQHSKVYEHIGVISAALTLVFYTMYIMFEKKNLLLLISILPVVFGIMRYYIVAEENRGNDPSKLLLDKQIILTVLIWFIIFLLFGFSFTSCAEKPIFEERCDKIYYKDFDRDRFSDGITSCYPLEGYFSEEELISTYGDCNDNDPFVYPGSGTGGIICETLPQTSSQQ